MKSELLSIQSATSPWKNLPRSFNDRYNLYKKRSFNPISSGDESNGTHVRVVSGGTSTSAMAVAASAPVYTYLSSQICVISATPSGIKYMWHMKWGNLHIAQQAKYLSGCTVSGGPTAPASRGCFCPALSGPLLGGYVTRCNHRAQAWSYIQTRGSKYGQPDEAPERGFKGDPGMGTGEGAWRGQGMGLEWAQKRGSEGGRE